MKLFKNYAIDGEEGMKELIQDFEAEVESLDVLCEQTTYEVFIFARVTKNGWTEYETRWVEMLPVFIKAKEGIKNDFPFIKGWTRFLYVAPDRYFAPNLAIVIEQNLRQMGD